MYLLGKNETYLNDEDLMKFSNSLVQAARDLKCFDARTYENHVVLLDFEQAKPKQEGIKVQAQDRGYTILLPKLSSDLQGEVPEELKKDLVFALMTEAVAAVLQDGEVLPGLTMWSGLRSSQDITDREFSHVIYSAMKFKTLRVVPKKQSKEEQESRAQKAKVRTEIHQALVDLHRKESSLSSLGLPVRIDQVFNRQTAYKAELKPVSEYELADLRELYVQITQFENKLAVMRKQLIAKLELDGRDTPIPWNKD